jgi:tRNA U34 5-carboxymethylaminomethyl modifying GTPase MnmE/TrmE
MTVWPCTFKVTLQPFLFFSKKLTLLLLPAPYSYTTYPTVELHIHSGRALISALLSSLSELPTLRPADPGEFTRQALLRGRLDLTQVEGLHDLIEADTEVQRVWALGSAAVLFSFIQVFSPI